MQIRHYRYVYNASIMLLLCEYFTHDCKLMAALVILFKIFISCLIRGQQIVVHVMTSIQAEIGKLRTDLAPALMEEPLSLEATAERYVRPELRDVMMNLCRDPVSHYLERFNFRSDLLKAMFAVTDGFSGLTGSWCGHILSCDITHFNWQQLAEFLQSSFDLSAR